MTYIAEIKETPESKPLIDLLKTLRYVNLKKAGSKVGKDEIVSEVRKSEKTKKIKWQDAKKQIASWK